jgi:putative peptidoglycan lipid II flippase
LKHRGSPLTPDSASMSHRPITRDLNVVVVLSIAAQTAAFLKSILIAYYFGISPELDGYFLAQVVPAIVTGSAISILQSSFIPTYASLRTQGRTDQAAALAGRLLMMLVIAGVVLTATVAVFAPEIIRVIAPSSGQAVSSAAIYSLRVLSALLLLNAVADFLGLLLDSDLRFGTAALAPMVNAIVASAFLIAFPELGLANLVWGTLLGIMAQVAVLVFGIRKNRFRIRLSATGVTEHVQHVGRLSVAALPSVLVANVAGNLPTVIASTFGAGAVSAFSYAWKLNAAATQAAGIAVGTVLLPHFATMLARNDHRNIRNSLAQLVPLIFAVAAIFFCWIWSAGEPFLRAAFQRGQFSEDDVQTVHRLWLVLALGLAPSVSSIALAKFIQAASSFAALTWLGISGLAILGVGTILLRESQGVVGLVIAVTASAWCLFALCGFVVRRRLSSRTEYIQNPRISHVVSISIVTVVAIVVLPTLTGYGDVALLISASLLAATGSALLVRLR